MGARGGVEGGECCYESGQLVRLTDWQQCRLSEPLQVAEFYLVENGLLKHVPEPILNYTLRGMAGDSRSVYLKQLPTVDCQALLDIPTPTPGDKGALWRTWQDGALLQAQTDECLGIDPAAIYLMENWVRRRFWNWEAYTQSGRSGAEKVTKVACSELRYVEEGAFICASGCAGLGGECLC